MRWFRGPQADPISEDDLADIQNFRLPPADPVEVEDFHQRHIREEKAKLDDLCQREHRLSTLSAEVAVDLQRTRAAREAKQAEVAALTGAKIVAPEPPPEQTAIKGAGSYKRPADGGANIVTKHILPEAAE